MDTVDSNKKATIIFYFVFLVYLICIILINLDICNTVSNEICIDPKIHGWALNIVWIIMYLLSLYLVYISITAIFSKSFPADNAIIPFKMPKKYGFKGYLNSLILILAAIILGVFPIMWKSDIEVGGYRYFDIYKEIEKERAEVIRLRQKLKDQGVITK